MTTTQELLARLARLDVRLSVARDNLQMSAPPGVLTPELRAELLARKGEIIRLLAAPSFAQEQFWLLDQLSPGNPAYIMTFAYRLRGALDADVLRRSLVRIARRHDVLHTVFQRTDDGPRPVRRPEAEVALPIEDASGLPDARQRLDAWLGEPFDLAAGPVFRAKLFRLADRDHLFGIAIHHIACDGWSRGVLVRELSVLYAALAAGEADPLPEIGLDYADVARSQRSRLTPARLDELLTHWRKTLAGADRTLELPPDRPRPPVQTFHGGRATLDLAAELTRDLRALARERKVTDFALLLAAFQALMHRLSGQDEVLVGIPASIRDRVEAEAVIGPFVNPLVIPSSSAGDPSFLAHVERTRLRVLDAVDHRDLPFERLVRELEVGRDPSRNPLFQVMFDLSRKAVPLTLPDLEAEALTVDSGGALVDLWLSVKEGEKGLCLVAQYNEAIFDAATVERWLAHYERLLEGVVADPERSLSALPLLASGDLERMLVTWNDTGRDFPRERCIHELFAEQVERTPQRIAVADPRVELTYAELASRARKLRDRLVELGVGRGDIVAVSVARSVDTVVSLLGILESGAAYLPLDPSYPRQRLAFMLEDSGAAVLLTDGLATRRLGPTRAADRPGTPADLAYVMYTSGSTGKPKGVKVSHRATVNLLTSMCREPGLREGDVLAAVTTISADISLLELLGPLTVGARVVVVPTDVAADGPRLRAELERVGATVMQATPGTWRLLAHAGWGRGAAGLRAWCGGEALPRDLAKELLAHVAELWNLYGPTETTIWSTCSRIQDPEAPIGIGRPIANTRTYVLDRNLQPAPVGVAGELYLGGDGVSDGYLHRPELTRERFMTIQPPGAPADLVYRTGDLVRHRPDGQLDYLGRIDGQVKVRGFRVELGEVEACMAEHESVEKAVASACRFGPGDVRLVGYVVPRDRQQFSAARLREFLRDRLPAPFIPVHFEVIDGVPLTGNGKIDRKALPPVATDGLARGPFGVGRAIEPPRTGAELAIAQAWRDVLKVEDIGVHDNFFDLGGHSLLAMQVVFRLERELGHRFTPAELGIQTLGQLAAACEVPAPPSERAQRGLLGGVFQRVTAKVREALK